MRISSDILLFVDPNEVLVEFNKLSELVKYLVPRKSIKVLLCTEGLSTYLLCDSIKYKGGTYFNYYVNYKRVLCSSVPDLTYLYYSKDYIDNLIKNEFGNKYRITIIIDEE